MRVRSTSISWIEARHMPRRPALRGGETAKKPFTAGLRLITSSLFVSEWTIAAEKSRVTAGFGSRQNPNKFVISATNPGSHWQADGEC